MRLKKALLVLATLFPVAATADGCLSVGSKRVTVTVNSPPGATPDEVRMGLEIFAMLKGGKVLSYAEACEDFDASEQQELTVPDVIPAAMLGLEA